MSSLVSREMAAEYEPLSASHPGVMYRLAQSYIRALDALAGMECESQKPICANKCSTHHTDIPCYSLEDAYMAGCGDYEPTTCGHCITCEARAAGGNGGGSSRAGGPR